MAKYICAVEASDKISKHFDIPLEEFVDIMAGIPAVDAVPVVRCRDCIYYDPEDEDGLRCSLMKGMLCPGENDYCSCGQRRDQFADVRKKEGIPDAAKETT